MTTPRRRRSPLGFLLIFVGLVAAIPLAFLAPLLAIPAMFVVAVVRPWLLTHGRKLTALDGAETIRLDRRPPVVLLRSFADDETKYVPNFVRSGLRRHTSVAAWFLGGYNTYEEHLAHALRPFGPVVAIGDPRDRLAPLGADRLYAGDTPWNEEVIELLGRARFVALLVAGTPSLIWECAEVLQRVAPTRFLLAVPIDTQVSNQPLVRRYDAFRQATADLFPHPLPAEIGDAQFITFDEDWHPRTFTPALDDASFDSPLGRLRREFRPHVGLRLLLFGALWGVVLLLVGAVVLAAVWPEPHDDGLAASAGTSTPLVPTPPVPSSTAAAGERWREVLLDDHAKARMPGPATRSRFELPVENLTVHGLSRSLNRGGELYYVARFTLPTLPIDPREALTILVDSELDNADLQLIDSRAHDRDGMPGLAFEAGAATARATGVMYARGLDFYLAVAVTAPADSPAKARRARFMKSLRLTG